MAPWHTHRCMEIMHAVTLTDERVSTLYVHKRTMLHYNVYHVVRTALSTAAPRCDSDFVSRVTDELAQVNC